MNFSIILPSRRRKFLNILLYYLNDLTHDTSNIEVLIGIDDDDVELQQYSKQKDYPFAKFYSRERNKSLTSYYNWLYTFSTGKYIIVANDDARIVTKDWDKILLQHLGDNVLYGKLREDGFFPPHRKLASFPVLSRKGIDALGWVLPEQYNAWAADVALFWIYDAVHCYDNLDMVNIEHKSHHTQTRERDDISDHVEKISMGRLPIDEYLHSQEYAEAVERLRSALGCLTQNS